MFGFGQRKARSKIVKAELGESLDHLMQAATHAANGVGATVRPRVTAAREAVSPAATKVRHTASRRWGSTITALAPLAVAAADNARQAGTVARKAGSQNVKAMGKKKKGSQMSRRRWPMLAGLLAAGAAVGATSAMVMRRRKQQQWDEYDPGAALEIVREDAELTADTSPDDPVRSPSASMPSSMDTMKSKSAGSGDKLSSTTSSITDSAKQAAGKTTGKAEGMVSNATTPSRNSRS